MVKLAEVVIYLNDSGIPTDVESNGKVFDCVNKAEASFIANELVSLNLVILCKSITTVNAKPTIPDDERDAKRYRWLRAGNTFRTCENNIYGGEMLDKLCDVGVENG
jgi:hypothetical protein